MTPYFGQNVLRAVGDLGAGRGTRSAPRSAPNILVKCTACASLRRGTTPSTGGAATGACVGKSRHFEGGLCSLRKRYLFTARGTDPVCAARTRPGRWMTVPNGRARAPGAQARVFDLGRRPRRRRGGPKRPNFPVRRTSPRFDAYKRLCAHPFKHEVRLEYSSTKSRAERVGTRRAAPRSRRCRGGI